MSVRRMTKSRAKKIYLRRVKRLIRRGHTKEMAQVIHAFICFGINAAEATMVAQSFARAIRTITVPPDAEIIKPSKDFSRFVDQLCANLGGEK